MQAREGLEGANKHGLCWTWNEVGEPALAWSICPVKRKRHLSMTAEDALARYRRDLPYLIDRNFGPLDISELRGKNLMCWCKIGAPCHADVLLEVANA
jgi:Domain of unknown function (DUF4326)